MGKWLAKFLADIPKSRTDKTDNSPLDPLLSVLSVPHLENPAKIIPSQPPEEPTPPILPGWQIVYMDHVWKLAGGSDDPDHGTVDVCRWEGGAWTVHLTDGQQIPLSRIRSVGAVDWKGRCYGAWTVREHGYDGQGAP